MTAWEVQMQFSHVLGHVVHFVITDSKWDTHIQDCPSMWYIYICYVSIYSSDFQTHRPKQYPGVLGSRLRRSPCTEVGFEKPPHIYGMHTLRVEKDVEELAEAYNRSAPLLGFVGGFNGWLFIVFLTSLRRHPTVDLCQVDIFSGYVWAFEEAAVIWRCLIPR